MARFEIIKNTIFAVIAIGIIVLPCYVNWQLLFEEGYTTPIFDWFFYYSIVIKSISFLCLYIYLSSKVASIAWEDKVVSLFLYIFFTIPFLFIFILGFADIYKNVGISDGNHVFHESELSLYFSIVTWTTLGYGDFKPIPDGRLIAAFQAMLGYVFLGCFVGFMLNILSANKKT